MLEIRQITEQDAEQLFMLRVECSHEAPEAFHGITTFTDEEDKQAQIQNTITRLAAATASNYTLGAFENGELLGSVGFGRNSYSLVSHRSVLYGLFVRPDQQGKGIALQLCQAVIRRARDLPGLEQIELGVHVENHAAIHLYEKLGFVRYGTIPRALKSGDRYIDEYDMALDLTKP